MPGAGVKFSFLSTKRWYIFLHAGGGLVFNQEEELKEGGTPPEEQELSVQQDAQGSADGQVEESAIGKSIPFWTASLGFEYYTKLRHFSIGLEPRLIGQMRKDGMALMLGIVPTVKYTF